MGLFKNFPYTNFHELNLDWFFSKWHSLFASGEKATEDAASAAEKASTAADGANAATQTAAAAAVRAYDQASRAESAATSANVAADRAESAANSLYSAGAINLLANSCFVWGRLIDRGGRLPAVSGQGKTYSAGGWVADRWAILSSPSGGADGGQLRFSSAGVQAIGSPCWITQWLPDGLPDGVLFNLSIYKDTVYSVSAEITTGSIDKWSDPQSAGFVERDTGDGGARVWIKVPTDSWISAVALRPGGSIVLPYSMPDKGVSLAQCQHYLTVYSNAKPARECKASSSGKYLIYFPEMVELPDKPRTLGTLYVASTAGLITIDPDSYTFEVKDGPYIEVAPASGAPTAYGVVTIWPSLPVLLVADKKPAVG